MTTLSLKASKKVYEIVRKYETEKAFYQKGGYWCGNELLKPTEPELLPWQGTSGLEFPWRFVCPAFSFAELIRALPKMQKATGNNEEWASAWCRINATAMVLAYMQAPTEQEGLRAVEKILMKIK